MKAVELTIPGLFAFVAYIMSYGMPLPSDLKSLHIFAVAGTLCGLSTARPLREWIKTSRTFVKVSLPIGILLFFIVLLSTYLYQTALGPTGFWEILVVSTLLAISFFILAVLLVIAGVSFAAIPNEAAKSG